MFVWDVVSSSETLNSVLITTSLCRRRLLCNRGGQTLTLLKEKKHLAMTSLHGLWQKWGSTTMLVYQFLFYLLLTPTLVSFRAGSFWNITITKTQCQRYRWCSLRKKKITICSDPPPKKLLPTEPWLHGEAMCSDVSFPDKDQTTATSRRRSRFPVHECMKPQISQEICWRCSREPRNGKEG